MHTSTPPQINRLLADLRGDIRQYVAWEGLTVCMVGALVAFFLGFALDYVPVLAGAGEMPLMARRFLLLAAVISILVLGHRWIVRRLLTPLRDTSLALLIERRHPELRERLLTSVEVSLPDGPDGALLLEQTRAQALEQLPRVDLRRVLSYQAMHRWLGCLAILAACLATLAWMDPDRTTLAARRLLFLEDIPYPRRTKLELLDFRDGRLVAARGSDAMIRVRADARRTTPPPRVCLIDFQLLDGTRGRVPMNTQGEPTDGYQYYAYRGDPFISLLHDVVFDVRGGDDRLRGQRIQVVDPPQVADAMLRLEFPAYTGLLPREAPYRIGMEVLKGTQVTMRLSANKPIVKATVSPISQSGSTSTPDTKNGRTIQPEVDRPQSIAWSFGKLVDDQTADVVLFDEYGITSPAPFRIHLMARSDQPPEVDVSLTGIGSAVTPEALLSLEGTVTDDYGATDARMVLETQEGRRREVPTKLSSDGEMKDAIDLRELSEAQAPFRLEVGTKVNVFAEAKDHFNLEGPPHQGLGDRFELDVVTAEQLLALLEAQELGLRQRLEQIIREMQETRDSLRQALEAPASSDNADRTAEAGAEPEDADEARSIGDPVSQWNTLRALRIQRGQQHALRASQEVLGVALEIDDIQSELRNNRIDARERMRRLEEEISRPLKAIADPQLVVLANELAGWDALPQDHPENRSVGSQCLVRTDGVISALEQVLAKMLDLETYNELLDLVRDLMQDQEQLEQKTREEQRRKVLELLK